MKKSYVGGHTNTVVIPGGPDRGLPVDTGFIVLNDRTYPLFNQFLSKLQVLVSRTDMSFSYTDLTRGLQYASMDLNSAFAQRKNLFNPSFWWFLRGILIFNRVTRERLHEGAFSGITLGRHLFATRCIFTASTLMNSKSSTGGFYGSATIASVPPLSMTRIILTPARKRSGKRWQRWSQEAGKP